MRKYVWFLLLLVVGCNVRPSNEELLQRMVVQTKVDDNTDFTFYNTFTLSLDTLGLISNRTNDTLWIDDYSEIITNRIKTNMSNAGYGYVKKNESPDLGFASYIVDQFNVYQTVSYPSYYSGYYGYGYGGYYGYPYVSTSVSSNTTLVINLIDLKNPDSQNRLKVLWTVYIGDAWQSVDRNTKVVEAIDQAFSQSAQIHK